MLVGRRAEQRRLEALLECARAGTSSVLVVRGEAGIGKTALIDHAVARADGFLVLRALGVESEAEIAFGGLQQLLRPVVGRLGGMPAHQARALTTALALDDGPAPEPLLVSAATLTLLVATADEQPLLCVVDDAHWLDDATARALSFAARRLRFEAVAMLFSAREPETAAFPGDGLAVLRLEGLTSAAAKELLAGQARDLAERTADELVAVSRGNPLALLELPRSLTEDQRAGLAPLDEPLRVSAAIERAYVERCDALSGTARRALLLVAAGDPADAHALWRALDAEHLAEGVAEGRTAGLLVRERLGFCHPLARSAVYHVARPDERRSAHTSLAAATAAPDRRAWHLAAATDGQDEDVAAVLEAAAVEAHRRGGVAAEARTLERAAELTPDVERRARRLLKAALAAEASGHLERAELMLGQVATLTGDRQLRGQAVARRSYLVADRGDFARAYALSVDEAADAPPRQAARALSLGAVMALTHTLDIRTAVGTIEQARRLEGQHEDADLHVVENLCRTWILAGRRDEAMTAVRASLDRIREPDELAVNFGTDLLYLEDYPRAREVLERVVVGARALRAYGFLSYGLDQLAKLETRTGAFTRAYALELESLQINEALGAEVALVASMAWLAQLEVMLGRQEGPARARRALSTAERLGDAYNEVRARGPLGLDALVRGDTSKAVEWLEPAVARLVSGGVEEPNFFRLDADLIEALERHGRTDDARRHLARLERQAALTGGAWAEATAARCRALLAPVADLQREFETALELHQAEPSLFDRARTELYYGERLRRARRRRDARIPLRSALQTFETIGARPWAERTRAELHATGEHAHRRAPGAPERLTPQEFHIATLVAEGLTNREVAERLFLSPKTVEFHLTGVFRKLDVRSRGELIRLFAIEVPEHPAV